MASLAVVRGMLVSLAKQLSAALATESRCAGVLPALPRYRRPQNADTGGYWIGVGRLGRTISMELWLDHYSGLSSPRAWFGLSSRSSQRLTRLLSLPPLVGRRKGLVRRSTRDVTRKPPYRFIHPLQSNEFDTLVQEHYAGDRDYLGIFLNYSWPFLRHDKAAILRDAANLGAMFSAAFARVPGASQAGVRMPGPWSRPDPRTERAAVRHVSRYLRKSGYSVKTREREICGYDLHATRGADELHVEVKGCVDVAPRFFISRTEIRASTSDPHWRLAVITCARSQPPAPRLLTSGEMRRRFTLEPTEWEGRPASAALMRVK